MLRSVFHLVPALVFLLGCPEYNLENQVDPPTPTPTDGVTDTGTTGVTTCGALDLSAGGAVDGDPTCVGGLGVPAKIVHIDVDLRNEDIGDASSTPAIGQLTDDDGDGRVDGDDAPDIAVVTADGTLWVLSNDLETTEWTASAMGADPASPAIGDVNGDGRPDVVVAGELGVAAYDGNTGDRLWATDGVPGAEKAPTCGGVGLYDLDLDGHAEVVIGRTILNGADGSLRGAGQFGEGSAIAKFGSFGAAADLDGDGDLEVVVGNAAYAPDGTALWANGQADGFVGVADFDGDAGGEIVVASSGDAGASVRLQDSNGDVLWTRPLPQLNVGPPVVADLDGDGALEIGVATTDTYYVLDATGADRWTQAIDDTDGGFTGASAFDFEGDGVMEIIYGDQGHIYMFDGATGDIKEKDSEHASSTCTEYPAIADIDGDGHADIVHTSSQYVTNNKHGVRVLRERDRTWMPTRPVWNQHNYAITNVTDDARLPDGPAPNWPTFNSWRAAGSAGGAAADAALVPGDVCLCQLVVRVANEGGLPLPAGLPVSAYAISGGAATWFAAEPVDALAPGEVSAGLLFEAPAGTSQVRVVVDDDGAGGALVQECHEANNTLTVDLVCP